MFENIKAKSIINKKGFGDLLKTNYWNYDTMILKYIKPDVVTSGLYRKDMSLNEQQQIEEELNLKINERLNKLKELWKETHNLIKDKKILDSLERLIRIGENSIKYKEQLDNKFSPNLIGINNNDQTIFSIYNGDIYLFNDNDCSLFYKIDNDLISYISTDSVIEKKQEYKQKYITPEEPIDLSILKENKLSKEYSKSQYLKDLAKYQAELIKADVHNREEDKKHTESINQTSDIKYVSIYFYLSVKDKNERNKFDLGEELKIPYGTGSIFNYLIKYLPNIDKYNLFGKTVISNYSTDGKEIKGYNIVGNKNIGYINLPSNKLINSMRKIDNSFEIKYDKNKIVVKKYDNVDIKSVIKKEFKNIKFKEEIRDNIFDCYNLGSEISYLYNPAFYVYRLDKNTTEVLFQLKNNDTIYIYSDCVDYELSPFLLAYTYQANDFKIYSEIIGEEFIKKNSYNIIEIENN